MRTPEDERYAVAVLLFKMMLIGKNPYARSDGKTLEEYIAERDFVFPLGYEEAELMPKGPWQLIWFNMPQSLRKAFYDAFRNDIYPKTEEWIPLIEEYITLLSAGRYPADIFPADYDGRHADCPVCGFLFRQCVGYFAEHNGGYDIARLFCGNILFVPKLPQKAL